MIEIYLNKANNMVKIAIESYQKPTPKKWRKIGDAILIIGSSISSISAAKMNPYVSIAATVLTVVGKIITNFASE